MNEALREAVARRIRALLEKTEGRGASEAEAMAAAAKARVLMDRYRLTQSDIEIAEEPIDRVEIDRPNAKRTAAADLCLFGIDVYCGVKSWFHTTPNRPWYGELGKKRLMFIGLKSDVEMAVYLYRMITTTIEAQTKLFAGDGLANVRREKQSFRVGMARRINERLKEMAAALEGTAKTGSGTALVVVKAPLVQAACDAFLFGKRLGTSSMQMRAWGGNAYQAGRAAGERVNLGRPVGGLSQGRLR